MKTTILKRFMKLLWAKYCHCGLSLIVLYTALKIKGGVEAGKFGKTTPPLPSQLEPWILGKGGQPSTLLRGCAQKSVWQFLDRGQPLGPLKMICAQDSHCLTEDLIRKPLVFFNSEHWTALEAIYETFYDVCTTWPLYSHIHWIAAQASSFH